jgi:hypothetical protein
MHILMHFSWLLRASDPAWAILQVFDALASLPFLKDLHMRCWSVSDPSLQLRRLPHLENLTFIRESWQANDRITIIPIARLIGWSQPKLTTLVIADHQYFNTPRLNDYLSESSTTSVFLNITHLSLKGLFVKVDAIVLPHLKSLVSLTTEGIFSPQDQVSGNQGAVFSSGNVWSVLRLEKIHLQEIVTDDVQLPLIEYLTSFSGLRRLRLNRASSYCTLPLVSDQLGIKFYERALQNHIHSLDSLEINTNFDGNWCFASHCSSIIKKCTRLTFLELPINSQDMAEEKDDELDDLSASGDNVIVCVPTSVQLYASKIPVQWSLLDICTTHPALKTLKLFSTSPERSRGFHATHLARANAKISRNVTSYKPITSSHALRIFILLDEFELRRDELGMNLGYRRIGRITQH